tara:strand:+ start:1 stop:1143 length:1143 start_codon:yes stop_codon:yes gene_type:complete
MTNPRKMMMAAAGAGGDSASMFAWGKNQYGQSGLGDVVTRSSPVQVGDLADWADAAGGENYNIFLKTDGTVWGSGTGSNGRNLSETKTSYSSPVQMTNDSGDWIKISSMESFSQLIKDDGTLWNVGGSTGNRGSVGDGTAVVKSSPIQVGVGKTFKEVAGGWWHGVAITESGQAWSWGYNNYGQLGQGTVNDWPTPGLSSIVQMGSASNWTKVACGPQSTALVNSSGEIWFCGQNAAGVGGINSETNVSSLTQETGGRTDWADVRIGSYYNSIALTTGGTIWSSGHSGDGDGGRGNTTSVSVFTQIGSLTTWASIGANRMRTVGATKTDGTLWLWGAAALGQLGDGQAAANRSSPVQLGSDTGWATLPSCWFSMFGVQGY